MYTWSTYFKGVGFVALLWITDRVKPIPFVGEKISRPLDGLGGYLATFLMYDLFTDNLPAQGEKETK